MTKKDILLVLPRASAYDNKNVEGQLLLEGRVKDLRCLAEEVGRRVCCFAEDQLACRLLFGEEVTWVSVLSDADRLWLGQRDALYEWVLEQGYEGIDEKLVQKAVEQYAYPREVLRGGMKDGQGRECFLAKRIRYACNKVMENVNFIAVVRIGESYCSVPKPTVGDGRRIIFSDENGDTHYYSGLAMEGDLFRQAVKGEMVW